MEKVFLASNYLRPAENNPNSSVFAIPSLYRLLYGTGIRINEALRLSAEMFPLILHKTNELYSYLFPDIYKQQDYEAN
jgi:hypothetical protein